MTGSDSHKEREASGLPIDTVVMFSDHKNRHNKGREKRQTNLMRKISFIKPFLDKDETIMLLTTGALRCFPYGIRSLFVFTNKRIFHIPTERNYSYICSVAQILYGDCRSIAIEGLNLVANYENGKIEEFYIELEEKKKIKELLKMILLRGEQSKTLGRAHLCPRCTEELMKSQYNCPRCHLEFKNEREGKRFSWRYPGAGYFYARFWFTGIATALSESILILFAFGFAIMARGHEYAIIGFFLMLFIILIERLVTEHHVARIIQEYIPQEKEVRPMNPS